MHVHVKVNFNLYSLACVFPCVLFVCLFVHTLDVSRLHLKNERYALPCLLCFLAYMIKNNFPRTVK